MGRMTRDESERDVHLMNQPHLVSKNGLPLEFMMWCWVKYRDNFASWSWR